MVFIPRTSIIVLISYKCICIKLPIKELFLNYYLFYESWVLITLPIVDTIASYEFEIQVTKSILF